MTVLLDDSDDENVFELSTDATGGHYFKARDTARSRVDLRRLVERYAGTELMQTAEGYKTRCFLPSAVHGFAGTCAEQDESEGHPGQNLSVTLAEDGTHWRWRCFSCGRGQTRDGSRPGDVVDLVTAAEGHAVNEGNSGSLKSLRFVLRLANLDHVLDGLDKPRTGRAPIDVSLIVDKPVAKAKTAAAKVELSTALKLNETARKHWRLALCAGADSEHARIYLETRGITDAQIKRYAIGYARPSFRDLAAIINPRSYTSATAMGLLKLSRNGKQIDSLRDRIVFPYCYPARLGRPIGVYGFAGRNLVGVDPYTSEDREDFEHHDGRPPPKWHNSKNVAGVWKKREDMLGVWQSLAALRKGSSLVICEGAFDMLAFDRLNTAAWALVGKEFTVAHALLIRSTLAELPRDPARRYLYACDGETAGRKAVIKFAASMLAAGFSITQLGIIDSDDGQDPATTEPEQLAACVAEPVDVCEFLLSQVEAGAFPRADLRLLISSAPQLAERFGFAPVATKTLTVADAAVVDALVQEPALAQHLARDDAERLLGECPSFDPTAYAFGDATKLDALPRAARRAWLHLARADAVARLAAHDATKPEGGSQAWQRARMLLAREVRKLGQAVENEQQKL